MHFTIAFEKNVSFVHRFVEIDLAFIKLHAVLKASCAYAKAFRMVCDIFIKDK